MDEKPISTEDLYGPSGDSPKVDGQPETTPPPQHTLEYEETPELAPVAETPPHTHPHQAPAHKRRGSLAGVLGALLFFGGMFALGIWLSTFLRQYVPTDTTTPPSTNQGDGATPTPLAGGAINPLAEWKTYEVKSGTTKEIYAGIRFRLPPDVLSPICDGVTCASQGTYLPGGTRFTVAPRGAGELLKDFRGSVISDVNGISFTTKPVVFGGLTATEFTGTFTGRTVSGYAFSRMRGVMVALTPTTSLEINHFTPSGITADFEKDDALFNQILQTFSFGAQVGEKGAVMPVASPASTATSSGF